VPETGSAVPPVRRWPPPWLDSTLAQILIILLSALLLTHATVTGLTAWLRPDEHSRLHGPTADMVTIATAIRAMRAVPAPDRPAIAAALGQGAVSAGISAVIGTALPSCEVPQADAGPSVPAARAVLATLLTPADRVTVRACAGRPNDVRERGAERLQVVAPEVGAIFLVDWRRPAISGRVMREWGPIIGGGVFVFLTVATLSVWAVRRIMGPLHRLARGVERFGRDVEVAPLIEEGPLEIRAAARSINQMQERIASLVHDRTRMLAAISHDLRTPITRLRLRVELEQSGDFRAKTLRDLDLMQAMVSSALSFLRGAKTETAETIDLAALVQSLCDEAAEAGHDVTCDTAESLQCRSDAPALGRAITNLVENACRYGGWARVSLYRVGAEAVVDVADRGPGIPDQLKAEALQPFARLNSARAMGDGVGLGLAIVADIARRHGGHLLLLDAPGGGLLARLVLPAV
jgi:signal transduction histidine kinase